MAIKTIPADQKLLTDYLIDKKIITQAQLNEAISEYVKGNGKLIKDILIEKGFVKESEIVKAQGEQMGIPFVDLTTMEIEPMVLKIVPRHISEKHKVLPLGREGNSLLLAMVNPLNIFAIDDIKLLTGLEIKPLIAVEKDLLKIISKAYDQIPPAEEILKGMGISETEVKVVQEIDEAEELSTAQLKVISDEAPIVRLSNAIIMQAVKDGASDIHVEPQKDSVKIRFRIDGVLHEEMKFPKKIHSALTTRYKILAKLNIAEKRLPQDGRIPIKVEGRQIDLRVATLPTVWGEKVTMRILDKRSILIGIEKLGFESDDLKTFIDLINKPYGIIFVTGPTGSGKTTTLYAVLNELNHIDKNLMSIEDPIEYQLPGVTQAQVNEKAGLTFSSALRSMLRQDPDIIMVGEIRDRETAETAVHASLTGHLVLATIHANDTSSTISRLYHMGVEPYLISSSVIAILAQRLVRTICPECKIEYIPPQKALDTLGIAPGTKLFKGEGCDFCRGKGYYGRIGVFELLKITDDIRDIINQRASAPVIRKKSREMGMSTLQQDGIRKVIKGITSIEEVIRVLFDIGWGAEELHETF